jgi:hypothetical protein
MEDVGHLVYFVVIWYILWLLGIFCGYLVYCVVIWYIVWLFGILCGYLVYFVVIWYILCNLMFSTPEQHTLLLLSLSFSLSAFSAGATSKLDHFRIWPRDR